MASPSRVAYPCRHDHMQRFSARRCARNVARLLASIPHQEPWPPALSLTRHPPPAERLLDTADLVLSVDAAEAEAGPVLSSLVGTSGDATWPSTENPAVSVRLTSAGGGGRSLGWPWVGRLAGGRGGMQAQGPAQPVQPRRCAKAHAPPGTKSFPHVHL